MEKLAGEVGQTVALHHVMMVGGGEGAINIGTPTLDDAWVEAQIVDQKRGQKIIIFKHKRRKGYRRKQVPPAKPDSPEDYRHSRRRHATGGTG